MLLQHKFMLLLIIFCFALLTFILGIARISLPGTVIARSNVWVIVVVSTSPLDLYSHSQRLVPEVDGRYDLRGRDSAISPFPEMGKLESQCYPRCSRAGVLVHSFHSVVYGSLGQMSRWWLCIGCHSGASRSCLKVFIMTSKFAVQRPEV